MLDALRAAALSNVDDLTTRRIDADALVERGDPEGERILHLLLTKSALESLRYGPCSAVREVGGWSLTIDTERPVR